MKNKIALIILLTIFIPLTLTSDTQIRFKVCVYTSPLDSNLETRLTAFVKRELRALGDVDIVGKNDDWHFLFKFSILEHVFKDGRKTGWLSISESISEVVPKSHFKVYNYTGYSKPVYPPIVSGSYWEADGLLEYAIQVASGFDGYIAKIRELLNK